MKLKRFCFCFFYLILVFRTGILFPASSGTVSGELIPAGNSAGLRIYFIDVGQGDSSLVITPGGKTILIDAGGIPEWAKSSTDTGEEIVAPLLEELKIGVIDYIVFSHPHSDHIGGMEYIIRNFTVGEVWDPGFPGGDIEYSRLLELIRDKKIKYRVVREGESFELEKELLAETFGPPKNFFFEGANNASIIMKITYRKFSALWTGDAEMESEVYACERYGNKMESNLLKVGHHGSLTSTSEEFLRFVNPETAVIQCGRGNRFGHPYTGTLARLSNYGIEVWRNDQKGDIFVSSDGSDFSVSAYERPSHSPLIENK